MCGISLGPDLLLLNLDNWIQKACFGWHLLPEERRFLELLSCGVVIKLRLNVLIAFETCLNVLSHRNLVVISSLLLTSVTHQKLS